MEKNLSKEFRETMEEIKSMARTSVMSDFVSTMDEEVIMRNIKALCLVGRLMDLCCDVFEKRERLLDRMDKVVDNCLEQ